MRYRQLALNVDLSAAPSADQAQVPDWIELIPSGPGVVARDGRSFVFDAAAAASVQAVFVARGVDLCVDINHALQLQAPGGGESPAAGWIDKLDVRDGALWGHVD